MAAQKCERAAEQQLALPEPLLIGEVVEATEKSFQVTAQGGRIEVLRAKLADGKKVAAGELLAAGQIKPGALLGG